jgi:hypothetical protein
MSVVEENVSSATWLPRMADFEVYNRLVEDCSTPMTPESIDDGCVGTGISVLGDRTNVPENMPMTPVVHRKSPIDGTRRSTRKSRTSNKNGNAASPIDPDILPYKPRKSKYDIH